MILYRICIWVSVAVLSGIQCNISPWLPLSADWSEQCDAIWPHGEFCVTLLANLIRTQGVSMYFVLHVTDRSMPRLRQPVLMVIKVDWLQHVYDAAYVGGGGVALVCGSYLCMLAWCHSRCHCWCRSLWQCCPLRSSRTPADRRTSRSGPRWCRHQTWVRSLGYQGRHRWSLSLMVTHKEQELDKIHILTLGGGFKLQYKICPALKMYQFITTAFDVIIHYASWRQSAEGLWCDHRGGPALSARFSIFIFLLQSCWWFPNPSFITLCHQGTYCFYSYALGKKSRWGSWRLIMIFSALIIKSLS